MSFIVEKIKQLVKARPYFVAGLLILFLAFLGGGVWKLNSKDFLESGQKGENSEVSIPTILGGNLVLPKITTGKTLGSNIGRDRLAVNSANLIGITDEKSQKISAIRILGEMTNVGSRTVLSFSPFIRFFNASGQVVGQKIGRMSNGFDFFGIDANGKSLYDVTVDDPPVSDKLEIVLNVESASSSALFDGLKIASRSIEVKTAMYQQSAASSQQSASETGSSSDDQSFEYYTVSGSVVNPLDVGVTDIAIYAWVKDTEDKVFSVSRQSFKNDLLSPGEKIDFRLNLLPLKADQKYVSYDIVAWGRRYRMNQ